MTKRILVAGILAAWASLVMAQGAAAPAAPAVDDAKVKQLQTQLDALQKELDTIKASAPKSEKADKAKDAEKEKSIIPKWVENFTNFAVDLRYRFRYEDNEATHEERYRNDLRARVAINGKVNDSIDLVCRLGMYKSLGADPVSSPTTKPWIYNSSLNTVWVDLAYIDYHPGTLDKLPFLGVGAEWLEGVSPFFRASEFTGIHVLGGKFEDPYYHPGNSGLMFDGQGFEGIAATYKKKIGGCVDGFGTLGGYWLREYSTRGDSGLFAAQLGGTYKVCDLDQVAASITGAAAYYYFSHLDGRPAIYAFAGNSNAGGVYVNDYNIFNLAAECGLTIKNVPFFETVPIIGFFDYANNTRPTRGGDDGYLLGLAIGKAKKLGDLRLYWNWRELQADCTVGSLNEGPFSPLGTTTTMGTNSRGHAVTLDVTLMKGVVFGVKANVGERQVAGDDRDFTEVMAHFIAKF